MTPQQFDATPESAWDRRYRYELVNGVLIVTPPVSDAEADPNDELGHMLRTFKESHPLRRRARPDDARAHGPGNSQSAPVRSGDLDGAGTGPGHQKDVPSIVAEFVSAQRRDVVRDYELKRDEYMTAGVQEYWIIDRFRRIMTVYRNDLSGPVSLVVRETETYQTNLLPGFELPLSRLLAAADELSRLERKTRKPNPPAGGTDG